MTIDMLYANVICKLYIAVVTLHRRRRAFLGYE